VNLNLLFLTVIGIVYAGKSWQEKNRTDIEKSWSGTGTSFTNWSRHILTNINLNKNLSCTNATYHYYSPAFFLSMSCNDMVTMYEILNFLAVL